MKPSHPWKARLIVGIIMLALAFFGMAITDIRRSGGWHYWEWIVLIYAILSLWLSWYIKRTTQVITPITLWHEILHWSGAIASIFLVSYLVHLGTTSRFVAGMFELIILALTLFFAGIYIESTFMIIALVLAIFAILTAVLAQYVYFFIIPIIVVAVVANVVMVWLSHRKFKNLQKK